MRVKILARPDHSLLLYNGLKHQIDVDMLNFKVFHEGSLLNKLMPAKKTVSNEVNIIQSFTAYTAAMKFLQRFVNFDFYTWESRYSELAYGLQMRDFSTYDLVHYWPVYCHKQVNKYRSRFPSVHTLGEIYSANPRVVINEFEEVYEKYNLNIKNSYFYRDCERNLAFLAHETNIMVPSKYVADTYAKEFPHLNIYQSSFGALGADLFAGIDLSKEVKTDVLKVVFVGTISVEKGVDMLIEAVKGQNVHLSLYGPIHADQEHVFKPFFNVENVTFKGRVPNTQIKQELRNYDLFVLPSLTDAYSLAVVEAILNGLPVIVSDQTGNMDDVLKFGMGKVFKSKSKESLIEAISQFDDYALNSARQGIEEFIRNEKSLGYPDKVLQVYKQITGKL